MPRRKNVAIWVAITLAAASIAVFSSPTWAGAVEDPTLLSLSTVSTQVVASTSTWARVDATTGALSDLTFDVVPAKGGASVWHEDIPSVGDVVTGEGGVTSFEWRGRYEDGKPVPDGAYILEVVSVPDPLDVCGEADCTQTRTVNLIAKNYIGSPDRIAPAAPHGLVVVPAAKDWMTWTASPDIDVVSYVVYVSPTDTGPWTSIGKTARIEFEDPLSRPGEAWYAIRAVDASGNKSARSDPASNDVVSVAATIGPAGGTIATTSKSIKLVIPAGALSSPVDFTITKLVAPVPPASQIVSGPVFDITPHGQVFAVPAQLTVRLKVPKGYPLAKNYPADTALMGYFNTTTLAWEKVSGSKVDPAAGTVTASLSHLSSYGPLSSGIPHGSYGPTTNYCGWCHTSHVAPGPTLHPYSTQKQTCYQCHNNNQRGTPTNISTASFASGTATLTTTAAHGIALGDPIWVAGVTPAGYNGAYVAKSVTATSLTYRLDADPGGGGSGGTVRYGYTSGSTIDVLGQFGETTPNTTTKTSYHPVPTTLPSQTYTTTCSDCHTGHRDPAVYESLLRRPDGLGGYLYSLVAGPKIGTQFCTLACHDSTSAYPAPYGNHVITGRAHDGVVPGGLTEIQRVDLALNAGTSAVDEVQQVNISGIASGTAAVNEVQRITLSGGGNSDTYILRYTDANGTCTTGNITKNWTAAQVQAALNAATGACSPSLNGNVAVAGAARGPYDVTFQNALAGTNVQQMTFVSGTGGLTAAISTTTQGAPAGPGEHFRLTFNGQQTSDVTNPLIKGTVTAAQVDAALEALSNIGAGDVSVTGTTGTGPFTVTFTGALGGTNVTQMTGVGMSGGTVTVTTPTQGVPGVPAETFTLTFSGQTTTPLTAGTVPAAQVDAALEALSTVGAGNVVVTGTTGTGPFTVTFAGTLANTNVPQMTGTASGGGAVTVTTTTNGVTAVQPTGNITCLNCHQPHASDNTHLTSANQESLCFNCHTAATPNASGGANPPWTMGPITPSNPYNEFNAKTNDYSTVDGNGVRIYHHPIATGEQAGGTRKVECASCHNVHIADNVDGATTSRAVDPAQAMSMTSSWNFGWGFTSGYMNRGTNVQQFCFKCHGATPAVTAPLTAGSNVPYDVRLVNDTSTNTGGDGHTHDVFTQADWAANSRHQGLGGWNSYVGAVPAGSSCGLAGNGTSAGCKVTCTNCHDAHGSTNAWTLRENVVSPDRYQNYTVTNATWVPGTITLTLSTAPTLTTSYQVVVSGVASSGAGSYNGIFDVNSVSGTTVTLRCTSAAPAAFCSLTTNPGAYQNGGSLVVGRLTLRNFDGLSTGDDPWQMQAFCRTCHVERGTHQNGNLCTNCHYHTSGSRSL